MGIHKPLTLGEGHTSASGHLQPRWPAEEAGLGNQREQGGQEQLGPRLALEEAMGLVAGQKVSVATGPRQPRVSGCGGCGGSEARIPGWAALGAF